MASKPMPHFGKSDPLSRLSLHIFCDLPDVEGLSSEQRCALHESFHTVLSAGYKLYQIVPPHRASKIIKKKFALMSEEK
jgi:hypothetical protein